MRKHLLLSIIFLFTAAVTFAQVTTSSMAGLIKDGKGETLIGATVRATHQPSGTNYAITTNVDGRFTINNMRVGGPYTVVISYIGFETATINDVYLRLGESYVLNQTLNQTGVSLSEVKITGRRDQVLNSHRTGASTNIGRTQLENLPTSSRSLQDFTRLTPQASGNSFGGSSNRYNNITIDGAVNNDVFGLSSSGTPGGQASTQPIALDAIQEIQVVLAPYDVTLGNFTGAGVNAVTRSGTNTVEGSVYYYNKSNSLSGKNVLTGAKSANYSDLQYGIRIGGPIIKNKLFFFANAELGRRHSPLSNNAGEAGAPVSTATAKAIADYTLQKYKYDVGSYDSQDLSRENNKVFGKIDWNISDKHQLTLRYNYIDAFDDNLTRSGTLFSFGNNAYKFANKQHVGIIELRSNFSQRFSNNLILGYTRVRDARETAGALFPSVQINKIDNVSANSVVFGSERSSVANQLDQDIFEFTDNFKINLGLHNITIGTHNEFFSFRNLFINNSNGRWTYDNLNDYLTDKAPLSVAATVSRVPGDAFPAAKFNAAQLGFYAQDEFQPTTGLKITAGIRVDVPVFGDKPLRNPLIEQSFPGYTTNRTPSTKPLFSPRIGFNYDVLGDRSIQLRGGTGIFTGRVPFVWLSNQYGSSGMLFSTIDVKSTGTSGTVDPNLQFEPDATKQGTVGTGSNRAEVDLVSNNFKIPQVFRSNLAADFKLPYGIIGTLEGIYTKTLNNVVYSDLNLKQPNVNGSGAAVTLNPAYSNGADTRLVYGPRVDNTNFTNVILLSNSNKGYTYNLTAQLQKTFDNGFSAMVAYTNTKAQSVNDGASSTALSNWEFVQIVNDPNNPSLATSNYQTRHRIVGSAAYSISYGRNKNFSTGVSLFYAGFSGQPFTYLYNGDLNGDGRTGNDLLYIPKSQSDIKLLPLNASGSAPAQTADQEWAALNSFIQNDPYLSKHRGEYAKRNGASAPFQHQFDFRVTQDIGGIISGSKNRIQLTFDIFNVGNLLNKHWGRQYLVTNQAVTLVNYVSNADITKAGYTFRAPTNNVGYTTSPFGSAWTGQFGVRYLFN
ncbi:TonB-dependent receptor [Mucilaginibacter terrigena]|uniref:TonB-dependent receptor n=1 Tax=Mucilaginibacter terrigena TaxID=2492395 RepID=A0A4Q5LRB6_9SPHI|nr:carboxypeptidase regulatory-like domain-containing protein [Mucilaginibacter terrigena]RYU92041.1 TonB-dependent receptor [Mucilaginibacter terrigena]